MCQARGWRNSETGSVTVLRRDAEFIDPAAEPISKDAITGGWIAREPVRAFTTSGNWLVVLNLAVDVDRVLCGFDYKSEMLPLVE